MIALYIKNAYSILMFAWSFYAAAAGLPAFCGAVLEKATKAVIIAGMVAGFTVCVRLETGGGALRPRAYGPRRHCLRCCIGWSQSGYLSEDTTPSGPLSERGGR